MTEEGALSAFHAAQAKYPALAAYQGLVRKKDQGALAARVAVIVGQAVGFKMLRFTAS